MDGGIYENPSLPKEERYCHPKSRAGRIGPKC